MGSRPQPPLHEAEDPHGGSEPAHRPLAGKAVAASAIAGVAAAAAGGALVGGDELIGEADGQTVEELADRAAESIVEDVPRLAPVEELIVEEPPEQGVDRPADKDAPGTFLVSAVVETASEAGDSTAVALGVADSDATPVAPATRGASDDSSDRGGGPAPERSAPAAERESRAGEREQASSDPEDPPTDREEPRGEVLDAPSVSGPEDEADQEPPSDGTPADAQEAPEPGSGATSGTPAPGSSTTDAPPGAASTPVSPGPGTSPSEGP